jgi:hypothetical protein
MGIQDMDVQRYFDPSTESPLNNPEEESATDIEGTDPGIVSSSQAWVAIYLVGIESLAGYAVTQGRLYSLQQMEHSIFPFIKITGVESAVACPVRDESRIAGYLSVSSTQPNYFLLSHLPLIESYANLVALAFSEEQFYAPERIQLSVLPNQQTQHSAFSNFRERVRLLLNEAVRNQQPLNIREAEQRVWQQLEEELLAVPFSREEESETNALHQST